MDEFDPSEFYDPPQHGRSGGSSDPDPELVPGPVLRRWERWRVLYNALLAGITLLAACMDAGKTLQEPAFWGSCLFGALMANLCYSIGPIAEAYLYWVGIRGRAVGFVLLGLGLMLSMFLAFGSVLMFVDPTPFD